MDWRIVAVARASIVLLFTVPAAMYQRVRLIWNWPRTLWIRSITGSVSMLLTFYALTHIDISTCITFTNTFPLWVLVLAWPVLGMRPTVGVGLALLSGIAGVALIEQPHPGEIRIASLMALAAAFCSAVVMIGLHRLKHLHPLSIVVHFSALASIVCIGYACVTHLGGQPLSLAPLMRPWNVVLLLTLGALASAGQFLMTKAFSMTLPQKLSVVGLSQVVFALGFDLLVWKRSFGWMTVLGIALVIAPVAWLLTGRKPKVDVGSDAAAT
jgi:drug/metabolite transporter (DMT)-like permease